LPVPDASCLSRGPGSPPPARGANAAAADASCLCGRHHHDRCDRDRDADRDGSLGRADVPGPEMSAQPDPVHGAALAATGGRTRPPPVVAAARVAMTWRNSAMRPPQDAPASAARPFTVTLPADRPGATPAQPIPLPAAGTSYSTTLGSWSRTGHGRRPVKTQDSHQNSDNTNPNRRRPNSSRKAGSSTCDEGFLTCLAADPGKLIAWGRPSLAFREGRNCVVGSGLRRAVIEAGGRD
jgi:hypothetical protein